MLIKFTHRKTSNGECVSVVDRSEGRVFYTRAQNSSVYSLPIWDFEKRFVLI